MDPQFKNEREERGVRFLTREERAGAQVALDVDHRLTDPRGRVLGANDVGEQMLFVVDEGGHLLVLAPDAGGAVQHSSLVSAENVRVAGELIVRHGRLVSISNQSGHYRPTLWALRELLVALVRQGVDLSATTVQLQGEIAGVTVMKLTMRAFDFMEAIAREDSPFADALEIAINREHDETKKGTLLLYKREFFAPLDADQARLLDALVAHGVPRILRLERSLRQKRADACGARVT